MIAGTFPRTKRAGVAVCLCLASVVVGGCNNKRTLTWYYADKAPEALAPPCKMAVVTEVPLVRDMPMADTGREELANSVVGELVSRGYQVTVLREKALAGTMPGFHYKQSVTATAGKTPTAKVQSEGASSQPVDQMTSRYKGAARVHAKVLAEVSMQASSKMEMHMMIAPIPFFPDSTSTEWKTQVRQATLRLSSPDDGTTLGAITVRYDKPHDKISDVVKDLACGLDMILQSRQPGSVEMLGPPGEIDKNKQ